MNFERLVNNENILLVEHDDCSISEKKGTVYTCSAIVFYSNRYKTFLEFSYLHNTISPIDISKYSKSHLEVSLDDTYYLTNYPNRLNKDYIKFLKKRYHIENIISHKNKANINEIYDLIIDYENSVRERNGTSKKIEKE